MWRPNVASNKRYLEDDENKCIQIDFCANVAKGGWSGDVRT